jgi:glycosyltransferase involved in cell wall biosynthesis
MVVGLSDSVGNELPEGMIAIPRTQSQVELAEIYSAADVVISTSKQETFGLTIAEGMACGTPAIVYNTTALPELITQQTGIVVEQLGNISALAEAVVEICERGKGHYSEACRRHVVENFDKNRCFDRYLQLYSELTK